jgi:hypothetical protein
MVRAEPKPEFFSLGLVVQQQVQPGPDRLHLDVAPLTDGPPLTRVTG